MQVISAPRQALSGPALHQQGASKVLVSLVQICVRVGSTVAELLRSQPLQSWATLTLLAASCSGLWAHVLGVVGSGAHAANLPGLNLVIATQLLSSLLQPQQPHL